MALIFPYKILEIGVCCQLNPSLDLDILKRGFQDESRRAHDDGDGGDDKAQVIGQHSQVPCLTHNHKPLPTVSGIQISGIILSALAFFSDWQDLPEWGFLIP